MIKEIVSVLMLSVFALTGCASDNDSKMSLAESNEIIALAEGEETRVEEVSVMHETTIEAIAELPTVSGEVKILGYALVNRDSADAMQSKMPEILKAHTRSTKGTDVQLQGVKSAEAVAPTVMGGLVGIAAVKVKTGDVRNTTETGNIDNTREEVHATGLGEGSNPSVSNNNPVTNEVEPEVSE